MSTFNLLQRIWHSIPQSCCPHTKCTSPPRLLKRGRTKFKELFLFINVRIQHQEITHIAWATPIYTFVNLNTDVHLHLKVKGKPIQSRERFITVCSHVGVKDNACTLLLETKNPLQIPNEARGPYIGGIQHCLLYHGVVKRFPLFQRKKSLNLTQHGNYYRVCQYGHQNRVSDQLWHLKVFVSSLV